MSVELWYGRKPRSAHVQQSLVDLYYALSPQVEHFLILCNFRLIANRDIDLVVLKRDGIFLAELCHAWDPIVGGREGEWKAFKPDGAQVPLRAGRLNPYKQVQTNYCDWRNWLADHSDEVGSLSLTSAGQSIFSYVVIYPDVPPGSQISIGERPVRVVGMSKFLAALALQSSMGINFSREQLEHIPLVLGLQSWSPAVPCDDPRRTQKLAPDWQPARVAALVALGHQLSAPMVKLTGACLLHVGRDDDNDIVIRHQAVSRRHAEIMHVDGRWLVRDLGSDNGTFISLTGDTAHERAVYQSPDTLVNHATIRFGPASYIVVL